MKTPLTPLSKQSFVASLLAEFELPELLPDDITPQRMAAQGKHSIEYWRKKLSAKEKAGLVEIVMCRNPLTSKPVAAYRPKPKL